MAKPDILLIVGANTGASYKELQNGINGVVKAINKNHPPKIKVTLDDADFQNKLNALKKQISSISNQKITLNFANNLQSAVSSAGTSAAKAANNVSKIKEMLNTKDIDASVAKVTDRFEKLGNSGAKGLGKIKTDIVQINTLLASLKSPQVLSNDNALLSTYQKLSTLLETVSNKISIIESRTNTAKKINFGIDTEKFKTDIDVLQQKLNELTNKTAPLYSTITKNMTELQAAFKQMNDPTATQDQRVAAYERLKALIPVVTKQVNVLTTEERIANNEAERNKRAQASVDAEANKQRTIAYQLITKITQAQKEWTAAKNGTTSTEYVKLQSYIGQLNSLLYSFNSNSIAPKDFSSQVKKIGDEFKITSSIIRNTGEDTKTLSDRFGSLGEKFAMWFSTSRIIMMVYTNIKKMISASIELNKVLTQLQIVTKETDAAISRFGYSAASSAKKVGSSITDFVDSATTYARLGYSLDESSKLAEFTAMLQNVGDIDVSHAQDAITSILKAFDDVDANQIESVMDKLVVTGNSFPISVEQISEGMTNASSALAAAGNSFDQSVALLTAANASVQNASKSSTGLRTIAARIRKTKTELDDLGETMTEADYDKLVQQLTDFNVSLTDINGEYRSTYDIMQDIAAKWNDMTSMEQAALAEALSGNRQQQIFYSIINNFQEASGAMDAMANSEGELAKANSKYMESTEAHIKVFNATFQELASTFFQSDFLKFFIDLGAGVVNVLNSTGKVAGTVIERLGGLRTVILGVAAALLIAKGGLIAYKVQMIATAAVQKIITFFNAVKTAILNIINIIPNAITAWRAYAAGVVSANTAIQASIPVIGLLLAAITAVTAGVSLMSSSSEDASESIDAIRAKATNTRQELLSLANSASESSDKIYDMATEYINAIDALESFKGSTSNVVDARDNLISSLQIEQTELRKLISLYGDYDTAVMKATISKLQEEEIALKSGIDAAAEKLEDANSLYSLVNFNAEMGIPVESITDDIQSDIDAVAEALEEMPEELKIYWSRVGAILDAEAGEGTDGYIALLHENEEKLDKYTEILGAEHAARNLIYYESLQEILKKLNEEGLDSSNFVYKQINDKYNELRESGQEAVGAIEKYNKNILQQYVIRGISDNGLPNSKEEFDELRSSLIESISESGRFAGSIDDIGDALDGVLIQFPELKSFLQDHSEKKYLTELSDAATKLKSNYDILATAQKEMNGGNGLSASTIKALADETKNYLDYLYEENGVLKLNIDKWKEYSDKSMTDSMSAIQSEINAIQEKNDVINKGIELVEDYKKANEDADNRDTVFNSIRDFAQETYGISVVMDGFIGPLQEGQMTVSEFGKYLQAMSSDVTANSETIAKNQAMLNLYNSIFDNVTNSLDAYKSALEGFTSVSDLINQVSESMTTLADIQETVANGFTLSLEKALEFASVYPQILDGATVSADGQITLNEDIVNSFIEGKQKELEANIDAKIKELQAEKEKIKADKEFAEAQLKIAKNVGEGKGKITSDVAQYRINAANVVQKALIDAGMDEVKANQLASAAMSNNIEEFDRVALEVCRDMDGNFNEAAYSAAKSIFQNATSMKQDFASVTLQIQEACRALVGFQSGKIDGDATIKSGSGGGKKETSYSLKMTAGEYNGTDYTYTPKTISLDKFISDVKLDISSYEKAMQQIDGQIAALEALRDIPLEHFSTSYKEKQKEAEKKSSGSSSKEETWFDRAYKDHKHRVAMEQETESDYLNWLNSAYKKAYNEGIIDLDAYYKYEEEVYNGRKKLAGDAENWFEKEYKSHQHYLKMEEETEADYLKWLDSAYKKAFDQGLIKLEDYRKYREEVYNGLKNLASTADSAIKELVNIRLNMLKDEIEREKEALNTKLSNLKDFYQKQKDMLQESYDNEKYLEEQAEKRKNVADIQAEIDQLRFDDSAKAQKRRIELEKELKDANKTLNDFEKEHTLKTTQDQYDKMYEQQEKTLTEQSAAKLYEKALNDIRTGSVKLYNDMIKWNKEYGDGISDTITKAWENAYKAEKNYYDYTGQHYNGVNLANATGYKKPTRSGYASGTSHATAGIHRVDEQGIETIFQSSDGQRYRMFSSGEKVLNANASDFLYKFANKGREILDKLFSNASHSYNNVSPCVVANNIQQGDIIIRGNADKATVSEIRRAQRENLEQMLKQLNRLK